MTATNTAANAMKKWREKIEMMTHENRDLLVRAAGQIEALALFTTDTKLEAVLISAVDLIDAVLRREDSMGARTIGGANEKT